MMQAAEIRAFLEGRRVHAFAPETRALVAHVDYRGDGRCALCFATGETDQGVYGIEGDTYWTRYDRFRGGETHAFRLERLGPNLAQAWFSTGARAFLQSHDAEVSEPLRPPA